MALSDGRALDALINVHTNCMYVHKLTYARVPHTHTLSLALVGLGFGRLQLAMNVQVPHTCGGVGGEAVYIDTEGSFVVERALQLAEALSARLTAEQAAAADDAGHSALDMLQKIHYFRAHDYVQQLALAHTLPQFCADHPNVRLVVVDSVSFHFRYGFDDLALRTRLLNGMAQLLLKAARDHEVAVVLINQMTTKPGAGSSEGSYLVPALGESWGHAATVRVIMSWVQGVRCARLYKSPSMREDTVPYRVTATGIADCVDDTSDRDARHRDKRLRV